MLAKTMIALSAALVLGTASAALADPYGRFGGPVSQHEDATIFDGQIAAMPRPTRATVSAPKIWLDRIVHSTDDAGL